MIEFLGIWGSLNTPTLYPPNSMGLDGSPKQIQAGRSVFPDPGQIPAGVTILDQDGGFLGIPRRRGWFANCPCMWAPGGGNWPVPIYAPTGREAGEGHQDGGAVSPVNPFPASHF
jgi:hypothetical protein